jgi:UDP-2,3-diacylglucosamine pyrophosphatase LpxH
MKILFLSDLHIKFVPENLNSGIHLFFRRVSVLNPDIVVLGGDNVEDVDSWNTFSTIYRYHFPETPTFFVTGNHEYYNYKHSRLYNINRQMGLLMGDIPTRSKTHEKYFQLCIQRGFKFLERQPTIINNILICGNSAWYDYSNRPINTTEEDVIKAKQRFSNDDNMIIEDIGDLKIAKTQQTLLLKQIRDNEKLVKKVFVFTHIPVLNYVNNSDISDSFFYNLTLGQKLIKIPSVRLIVSGHLHRRCEGVLQRTNKKNKQISNINHYVNGADYDRPEGLLINYSEKEDNFSIQRV